MPSIPLFSLYIITSLPQNILFLCLDPLRTSLYLQDFLLEEFQTPHSPLHLASTSSMAFPPAHSIKPVLPLAFPYFVRPSLYLQSFLKTVVPLNRPYFHHLLVLNLAVPTDLLHFLSLSPTHYLQPFLPGLTSLNTDIPHIRCVISSTTLYI